MASNNTSSTSTVLVALVLIITFPVWFAVAAALFGVAVGVIGAVIGAIGAILGVTIGLIALPFKVLFGWGHWGWHGFPHFHYNGFLFITIIIIAALIVRGRKTA